MAKPRNKGGSRRVEVQDQMANNPFADQLAALGSVPQQAPSAEPAPKAQETRSSQEARFAPKLVLRREKKGRGGKTITRIEGILGDEAALSTMAKSLGKALGARAFLDEGKICLSGDQCASAQRWLEKAGASKIVVGN